MKTHIIVSLSFVLACQSEPIKTPNYSIASADVADAMVDVGDVASAPETIVTPEVIPPKPQRILLIGDSQVQYCDWYFSRAKVKHENETVFFDSKPGTTIGYWNEIFIAEAAKYPRLDTVIIFLGTNNHPMKYLQPHYHILEEVKRRHLKCIWVGPTLVYGKPHLINTLIKESVSDTCTYFDTEQADISLMDGVHPTVAGGVKWLNLIWAVKDTL